MSAALSQGRSLGAAEAPAAVLVDGPINDGPVNNVRVKRKTNRTDLQDTVATKGGGGSAVSNACGERAGVHFAGGLDRDRRKTGYNVGMSIEEMHAVFRAANVTHRKAERLCGA
ncbi:MAG: hypothetical protein AAGM38_17810 [Pseudomonadota bacterium]